MEAGFIELLSILMSLSGFGVEANPNAPTSAEVMKYAPATADYMAYLDLESVVPNNYAALTQLPNHPAIKANARAHAMIDDVVKKAEAGVGMVKGMTGIDLTSDLKSVSAWIQFPDAGDPDALVVVRGNLPADLLSRAGALMGGAVKTYPNGTAIAVPEGKELLGLASDGTLLFGTAAAVERRLKGKWRARKPRANSASAQFAELIDRKPFFAVGSSPSKRAVRRIEREIDDPEAAFMLDFLTGHKFAAVALFHDGLGWSWAAADRGGFDRAVLASEGIIDLMRASHYGARGFVRVAFSAMKSYTKMAPEIAAILKHQEKLLQLVNDMTGDGQFKVDFAKQPKAKTLWVKAWDKELSDVLPIAGLLPAVGAGVFLASGSMEAKDHMHDKATVKAIAKPKAKKHMKKAAKKAAQ